MHRNTVLELGWSELRGRKRAVMLAVLLGWALFPALGMTGQTSADQTAEAAQLMTRVGRPPKLAVREFKKAGMKGVRPHTLTKAESARVQAALEQLPALNRDALDKHLHELSFVDGIPGEGTGLTSPAAQDGQYDLTFRASLITESLSTFLTTKERRVFTDDGSGLDVTVTGTGADALTYVLLHESSHVLDAGCSLIKSFPNAFDNGIWTAPRVDVPRLAQALATQTYFHEGSRLALTKAPEVYDSLARTPFVSLYATSSAREDFAELVTWRELQKLQGGTLTIEVKDPRNQTDRVWHPLSFPVVQERFPAVDTLEGLEHGCPA